MPQVPPSMMRRSCNASSRCGCRKVDKKIAFLSFLLVFFVSNTLWRIVNITSATPINVALHAQVPPSTGMVVGSAITMAGVKEALLRRRGGSDHVPKEGVNAEIGGGRSSGNISIAHAQIFYPFNYAGLHDRRWDLVIIEGWFRMINVFIHEVQYWAVVDILAFISPPAQFGVSKCRLLAISESAIVNSLLFLFLSYFFT